MDYPNEHRRFIRNIEYSFIEEQNNALLVYFCHLFYTFSGTTVILIRRYVLAALRDKKVLLFYIS